MTGHESLEGEATSQAFFQLMRDVANRRFADQSAADPTLAEFARTRGEDITQMVCDSFGIDAVTDPAAETFRSAYAKFVLAFTNPDDHDDTLSNAKILQIIEQVLEWDDVFDTASGSIVPQTLAYYADLVAGHMLMMKFTMYEEGELSSPTGAFAADDQYDLVWARFETLTQALDPTDPDSSGGDWRLSSN